MPRPFPCHPIPLHCSPSHPPIINPHPIPMSSPCTAPHPIPPLTGHSPYTPIPFPFLSCHSERSRGISTPLPQPSSRQPAIPQLRGVFTPVGATLVHTPPPFPRPRQTVVNPPQNPPWIPPPPPLDNSPAPCHNKRRNWAGSERSLNGAPASTPPQSAEARSRSSSRPNTPRNLLPPQIPPLQLPRFLLPGNGLIVATGNIISQLQQIVPAGILLLYPPDNALSVAGIGVPPQPPQQCASKFPIAALIDQQGRSLK